MRTTIDIAGRMVIPNAFATISGWMPAATSRSTWLTARSKSNRHRLRCAWKCAARDSSHNLQNRCRSSPHMRPARRWSAHGANGGRHERCHCVLRVVGMSITRSPDWPSMTLRRSSRSALWRHIRCSHVCLHPIGPQPTSWPSSSANASHVTILRWAQHAATRLLQISSRLAYPAARPTTGASRRSQPSTARRSSPSTGGPP